MTKLSYYYKDHLGSVTAVMDGASGTITQAQDYDAWGDICRTYSTTDTTVNKFTGKERDKETGYDYFGARYYDSRISVWLSPDPLFEKHIGWSPYNYVLRNPVVLIDPDGRQVSVLNSYSDKIFNNIKNDIFTIAGLRIYKNEKNEIKYEDVTSEGKSSIAREILMNMFGDITKMKVKLDITTERGSYFDPKSRTIFLNSEQINAFIDGSIEVNNKTMGFGFTFLHELLHPYENKIDDLSKDELGPIEEILNKIREQLGPDYGQRITYNATINDVFENAYVAFSDEAKKYIGWKMHPVDKYIMFNPKYKPDKDIK